MIPRDEILPHNLSSLNRRDIDDEVELTERQLECLAWTQEGKSASDIGAILGISGRTVEGHLAKVCQHLGVRTRIQAVIKAKDLGFLKRPSA